MGNGTSQVAPVPGAAAPGLTAALMTPIEIFNPVLLLSNWGLTPPPMTATSPAILTPATASQMATTSHPSVLGAVKPNPNVVPPTGAAVLPVVPLAGAALLPAPTGTTPAAVATSAANQASTAATTAKQAATLAQQSAQQAQQVPNNTPVAQQAAQQSQQFAANAQQACLCCQQHAQTAATAAQTASTTSGPVSENAAQQAQQAAANATNAAQQTIQHAQNAVTSAQQAGVAMPAGNNPIVTITPANAATPAYLDTTGLLGGLGGVTNTLAAPLMGLPTTAAAGLAGNPIAQQLLANPAAITPVVQGDARALTSSYISWKTNCSFDEYCQARKYFTWKSHCHNNCKDKANVEKLLADWSTYGQWKEKEWRTVKLEIPIAEYCRWKQTAEQDDSDRYREWRRWKKTKAEYKCKFDKQIQADLKKKKKEYLKFLKTVDAKEFASFYKYQQWTVAAQSQKLDVNDITAYDTWKKTYILDKNAVYQAYCQQTKNASEANFLLWVQWMRFQKLQRASADDTDPSSDSLPPWYKRDKRYGRHYQKYWRSPRYDENNDQTANYSWDGDRGSWDGSYHGDGNYDGHGYNGHRDGHGRRYH